MFTVSAASEVLLSASSISFSLPPLCFRLVSFLHLDKPGRVELQLMLVLHAGWLRGSGPEWSASEAPGQNHFSSLKLSDINRVLFL